MTRTRTALVRFVGSLRVSTATLNAAGAREAAPTCLPVLVRACSAVAPGTLVTPFRITEPCSQAVRGVTEQRRGWVLKTAVTARSASSVVEHAPMPRHAPDQPRNVEPGCGAAVSEPAEPLRKLAEQTGPQATPGGLLVTVPSPSPIMVT